MTPPPVVRVVCLRKSYRRVVAVDDVSFDVQAGDIFGLIGPNGAGKTTTMDAAVLLGTLIVPTAISARVFRWE